MHKTRRRILDYLQVNHSATCLDMSRSFGHTPANVRHHLRILEESGRLSPIGKRLAEGRGRPETLYALIGQDQNSAAIKLAAQLLEQQQARLSKSELQRAIQEIARALFEIPVGAGGSLTQRIVSIMQRFEALDYQPNWEATSKGPSIHLMQCPYASIIDDHPSLCQIDAAALEQALGQEVVQVRKLESNEEGLRLCTFALKSSIASKV